jgi:hypothetical protein
MVASLEGIGVIPYVPARGTRMLSVNLLLIDHAEVMSIASYLVSSQKLFESLDERKQSFMPFYDKERSQIHPLTLIRRLMR